MQEAKGKGVLMGFLNINLSYPDADSTNQKDKN
jgi:hypothetical protein